ncbi:MAG: tyrosine-type recombinase/integrase [Planctomycetota bacterium]|nr:tyrosine-type recombinase/integrase [Planctomycetota bacterium]
MASVYQTFEKERDPATGKLRFKLDAKGKRIPHDLYRYRYVDRHGRTRSGTGTNGKTKTLQAAREREAFEAKIRRGEAKAPKVSDELRLYQDATREYLLWGSMAGRGRGGFPWATAHHVQRGKLLEWWGKRLALRYVQDLSLAKVEQALQVLGRKLKPNTVERYREGIAAFCDWLVDRGYLESDPLRTLKPARHEPEEPHRLLKPEELNKLLAVAPEPRKLLYRVALATGYRQGELRALKVRNLDAFGPSLSLDAKHTKNRKAASQPIPPELATDLKRWIQATGRNANDALLSLSDKKTAWENFERDRKRAGIPKSIPGEKGRATFHSLRVSYVQSVVNSGADLKTIMELARHSVAQMTLETYAKPDAALKREAALKASELVTAVASREYERKRAVAGSGEVDVTQDEEGDCVSVEAANQPLSNPGGGATCMPSQVQTFDDSQAEWVRAPASPVSRRSSGPNRVRGIATSRDGLGHQG